MEQNTGNGKQNILCPVFEVDTVNVVANAVYK